MPCPDLGDTTVLTTDILWKISVTYKAVDYVGLKNGLKLRSENPEDKYVVLIQVTIQKKKPKRQTEFDLTSSKSFDCWKGGSIVHYGQSVLARF